MRFMLLLKGDPQGDPQGGAAPDERLVNAMQEFNQEMVRAGVLLAAEGLHASAHGAARVSYRDGQRTVIDGPFAEAKELIAGFYLIEVASMAEAVEWARRCPVEFAPIPAGEEAVIEIRQVADLTEFPDTTDEQLSDERRVRESFGDSRFRHPG